jgi:heme-degrading monooxygenase HmoA
MIWRIWHGRTNLDNADAYEHLLRSHILPGIHRVAGYQGAHLLRRPIDGGAEFVTITIFESIEAVKAFAGDDFEAAVISPEARQLLSHFDARSEHYNLIASA